MHGATLLYNLALSELRGRVDWAADYRERIAAWAADLDRSVVSAWWLDDFWNTVEHPAHSIRPAAKRFVMQWVELVADGATPIASAPAARQLVEERERRLKTGRFAIPITLCAIVWAGASGVDRLALGARRNRISETWSMLDQRHLRSRRANAVWRQSPAAGRLRLRRGDCHDLLTRLRDGAGRARHLALFAAENRDDILTHPLALLEGAERIAGRLLVFTDAGHIQAHRRPHSRLCSLLERIIVEVAAPSGGAFHPKMWALRFNRARRRTRCLRLLVLSRNLTRDWSWDVALTLAGVVVKRAAGPQATFVRSNSPPARFGGRRPVGRRPRLAAEFADDVRRTHWRLPEQFEGVAFAVNGFGGKPWARRRAPRFGVISPFCDDRALHALGACRRKPELSLAVSCPARPVPVTTLNRFGRVAVLDEMAASEDGEERSRRPAGPPAKAFIAPRKDGTPF